MGISKKLVETHSSDVKKNVWNCFHCLMIPESHGVYKGGSSQRYANSTMERRYLQED